MDPFKVELDLDCLTNLDCRAADAGFDRIGRHS